MSHQLLNTIIVAAVSIGIGVTAAALGATRSPSSRFRGKNLLFLAYIGAAADPVDADPDPAVPDHPEAALLQHLVGADPAVRGQRAAAAGADLPRLLRADPARAAGKRPGGRLLGAPGAAADRRAADQAGAADRRDPGHDQRLGRLPVALDRHPGPARRPRSRPASSSSSAASASTVSSGGAVFAAFVIATVPMFVLVGFTMRYFVSGLTEGALETVTTHPPDPRLGCAARTWSTRSASPGPGPVQLAAGRDGGLQRAYQIQVYPERRRWRPATPRCWDSGRVAVRRLRGRPLRRAAAGPRAAGTSGGSGSGTTPGRRRSGASPASFEVELDPADGWRASWIGLGPDPGGASRRRRRRARPTRCARRCAPRPTCAASFTVDRPVAVGPAARDRARPVRGAAERAAGRRRRSSPRAGPTTRQRVLYQTYDVTGLLRSRARTCSARSSADGWYFGLRRLRRQAGRRALRPGPGTAGPAGDQPRRRHHGSGWSPTAQWQGRFAGASGTPTC